MPQPKDTSPADAECRLTFKVTPGAPRDAMAGLHGEDIRVKLRAPPVEGKANAALLAFLADRLGLRASALRIVSGERARMKIVAIKGLAAEEARRRLLDDA